MLKKMDKLGIKHENKNWVKLPKELDSWMISQNKCEPIVVRPVKAGSMVLWDSRVIHANVQPSISNEIRIGSYICMVPRKWAENAPRKQLDKKKKAYLDARGTSHWPHIQKLFSDKRPFRNELTKDTVYSECYINQKTVFRVAVEFLKSEFQNNKNNLEAVARQIGFDNLEEFEKALEKNGIKKDSSEMSDDEE
jgi:hypothetical protein